MSWDIAKIPVVCINLDRKPERWERLQSQAGFSEFPGGIQRWSAKDAKTIDVNSDKNISLTVRRNIEKRRRRAHEDIGNVGAIGCSWTQFLPRRIHMIMIGIIMGISQRTSPTLLCTTRTTGGRNTCSTCTT